MWLRKQMEKNRLEVKPIGEYIAEVNAKRNNTKMGVSLSVGGIALFFALAFFWTYHSPEVNVATVILFIFHLAPVCASIVWGVYCLTIRKIKEPEGAVKRLVSEYLELRELLSKGDLWGEYVVGAVQVGGFEGNFRCWSTIKLDKLPMTLIDQANATLYRLGREVSKLGKKPNSSKSLDFKSKRFIPAWRAAVTLDAVDGTGGYGRYIPSEQ